MTCRICLEAFHPTAATWRCRAPAVPVHEFCTGCMIALAKATLAEGSALHCPHPGCVHTLDAAQVSCLVDPDALRAARAARYAGHKARLASLMQGGAGTGDVELAALIREGLLRPCPACSALIIKNGGCEHVACICGCSFDWTAAYVVLWK